MPTFQVGQKVVCINDRFKNVSIDQGIRKGQIYTVRWAGHYRHYVDGDFYGIKLMELYRGNDDGPEGYGAVDMPFRASRFRPLVSDRIRNMLGMKAPQPKVVNKPSIVPSVRPKPRVVTPEREKEEV
ncbi:CAP-Gly domain protein [Shinella curvata]|uniref:CAP-Gly domain protein n=1 Tax=Shinella curvata TaxID=1817964 RepID=A0ABT8XLX7_9HYPH|nr:CAP-Gly domain protein [Shinella curvata]MCJ8057109.1 CAP-Gly domain protein [Shinella curvata]MDO6124712.1 CAP-Gly domain protein [Shinella curvata]